MSEQAVDRSELRTVATRLLDDVSSSAKVRAMVDPPDESSRQQLEEALSQVGWPGIEVPEQYGGAGACFGDLAIVLTQLGAHLTPTRLFSTAVLGVGALLRGGTEEQRQDWLPRIAEGSAAATAAVPAFGHGADGRVARQGDALRIDGTWTHVPDADTADVIAVHARSDSGDTLVLIPSGTEGVTLRETPMFDLTRRLFTVQATGACVPVDALMSRGDAASRAAQDVLDRAALAIACDSLGIAERVLSITTDYVKQRVQFDRPVGSFQAVKHMCADMLIAEETSRVIVAEALRAADAERSDLPTVVSMAKSHTGDAAAQVAADGVTLHGGIGFTWEHDMHLYLKRAKLNQAMYGGSRAHRRRIADLALRESTDGMDVTPQ